MTDYLREARNAYQRAENMTDAEVVQTAALIAIAEALRPRTTEIKIEGKAHGVSGVLQELDLLRADHEHQEKELAALREVIQGADHTAAKYWRRMVDAESEAKRTRILMEKAIEEKEAAELRARNVVASLWYNRDGQTSVEVLRAAHEAWGVLGPCPTCQGPTRETVGLVCPTCGHDYGDDRG